MGAKNNGHAPVLLISRVRSATSLMTIRLKLHLSDLLSRLDLTAKSQVSLAFCMVGLEGIGPSTHAPHARVLPLYYSPIWHYRSPSAGMIKPGRAELIKATRPTKDTAQKEEPHVGGQALVETNWTVRRPKAALADLTTLHRDETVPLPAGQTDSIAGTLSPAPRGRRIRVPQPNF